VPYNAFTMFKAQYEEPIITEGFKELRYVNWVFEGSDEERRRWNMWLQLDGK
jgi:bifunctional polynucleotide phosphatase/kinase